MCASVTANLPLTCDRNPIRLLERIRFLPLLVSMTRQASAILGWSRAIPRSPHRHPSPRSNRTSHRKYRSGQRSRIPLQEIRRRARTRKRNCRPLATAPKAVSRTCLNKTSLISSLVFHIAIADPGLLCSGRTSVSSSNRTHVPYFRYFGPTAIVPGFKQMVRAVSPRSLSVRFL